MISGSNPSQFYKILRWAPSNSQYGPNIVCSSIGDTTCLYSTNYCFTLYAGVSSPSLVNNSITVSSLNNSFLTWSVSFNTIVQQPTFSTYIRFLSANGTQVLAIDVSNSSFVKYSNQSTYSILKWTTGNNFADGSYYIGFDSGIGIGTQYCSLQSNSETDQGFSSFIVVAGNITILSSVTSNTNSSTVQTTVIINFIIKLNKNLAINFYRINPAQTH